MGRLQEVREAIAACFQVNNQPLTKAQILAWIGTNYKDSDFNSNTLQTQLYRSCTNSRAKTTAPKILWFDKTTKTYRLRSDDDPLIENEALVVVEAGVVDDFELQADSTFALEAHLRDYLARNLTILEKGLQLWSSNPPSVEYMIDGRRIDLLAKDVDGIPVVIELKLNKSYDRVVGQALLYQGLVANQLSTDRVRIILVAGEVSKELKIACARQKDVSLFEYAITMQVTKVSSSLEEGI